MERSDEQNSNTRVALLKKLEEKTKNTNDERKEVNKLKQHKIETRKHLQGKKKHSNEKMNFLQMPEIFKRQQKASICLVIGKMEKNLK